MESDNNIHLERTLNAWAEIVLKQWRHKINHLKIGKSGELFNSLTFQLHGNGQKGIQSIDFYYKMYGRFVDMGVGREIWIGNPGDLGFTPTRQPKKWYSPVIFGELMALRDLLAEKYGRKAAGIIVERLEKKMEL